MSEILPSASHRASVNGAPRVGEAGRSGRAPDAGNAPEAARTGDQVELSEQSRLLSQLRGLPEVRTDLVERVRTEIESDAYLNDTRLDGAVEELARDLNLLA